jgi:hypothetical protein
MGMAAKFFFALIAMNALAVEGLARERSTITVFVTDRLGFPLSGDGDVPDDNSEGHAL